VRNYHHQPKENDIRSQHESIRKEEEYGSGSKEGKEPLPNCTHSPPGTIKKKKKKRERNSEKRWKSNGGGGSLKKNLIGAQEEHVFQEVCETGKSLRIRVEAYWGNKYKCSRS